MKISLLDKLCCPYSKLPLKLGPDSIVVDGEVVNGTLCTYDDKYKYDIKASVPRFVTDSNYADNFGIQWNYFSKTQLDSHSGYPISGNRFWRATGWKPEELMGKWVLDVGCGAGRFAEIALNAGANVVALDYSSAVDACYGNLKKFDNLHVIQGDIYSLPFFEQSFQFVYSLGVLQHTPDVKRAFQALPPMLVPNGRICVDYYWKRFQTVMHSKYLVRPFTKRMQKNKLFGLLKRLVPSMLLLSRRINKLPGLGKIIKRVVPVADYTGVYPLSDKQLSEWALMDTFDMLGPRYDSPQRKKKIYSWMVETGFRDIEVFHETLLVSRGIKG